MVCACSAASMLPATHLALYRSYAALVIRLLGTMLSACLFMHCTRPVPGTGGRCGWTWPAGAQRTRLSTKGRWAISCWLLGSARSGRQLLLLKCCKGRQLIAGPQSAADVRLLAHACRHTKYLLCCFIGQSSTAGYKSPAPHPTRHLRAVALQVFSYEWAWGPQAATCGIRRRTSAEVASAFANRRLLFVGDSHVRYLHNWLAHTLGGEADC